jgi:serine/threonine-protein phosphatase 2A regulatory subunit A
MFAAAYPGMGPDAQGEMRTMFTALCNDDTPMVRRAAAKALGVGPICVIDIGCGS